LPEPNPYTEGDIFLDHFLPGDSAAIRQLRGLIYRLNIAHRNHRMVPSILIIGEPGAGKGYTANVIAAHLWWLRTSKGMEVDPKGLDVYQIAADSGLRTQALTNLQDDLSEAALFGAKPGAYTSLTSEIIGVFDAGPLARRGGRVPDPFDVFLDEIGDASPKTQSKLLQILETRTFRQLGSRFDEPEKATEARIIAATNKDLVRLIEQDVFRADLYDRLMWAQLALPPLRQQLDQIPFVLGRINQSLCIKYALGEVAPPESDIAWARTYHWPGNHRELQQVVWEWHLFGGSLSFKEIVQRRSAARPQRKDTLEAHVMDKLFRRFDAVLAGTSPGFKTYGAMVEQVREIAYAAMFLFNKERQLKDEDLKRLFSDQDPTNVRKQISGNRPHQDKALGHHGQS
jgi:DNA-binding NtrC family response regulator